MLGALVEGEALGEAVGGGDGLRRVPGAEPQPATRRPRATTAVAGIADLGEPDGLAAGVTVMQATRPSPVALEPKSG